MRSNIDSSLHSKNEDIEVLRAVAVGLVVLTHLGSLVHWSGTLHSILETLKFWGGVDIFFCISGYVIAGTLLRQQRTLGFREFAMPFYTRRIFRIWPAAMLWLLIPVLAARYFNVSGAFGHFRADVIDGVAATLQLANLYFSTCSGQVASCGKEAVYWSLSLEEQFYLVFPLLMFFMRPQRLRQLLLALICVQFFLPRQPEHILWFFRTDAICYGVLIAMLRNDGRMPKMPAWISSGRGIAGEIAVLLILAAAWVTTRPELQLNAGLVALLAAALVTLASYDQNLIFPWKWVRPAMLWAGSRSYAIYLIHDPCFWATRELFHRMYRGAEFHDSFAVPFILVAGLLIVVFSEISYRAVEVPLRNVGRAVAERRQRTKPSPVPVLARHPGEGNLQM